MSNLHISINHGGGTDGVVINIGGGDLIPAMTKARDQVSEIIAAARIDADAPRYTKLDANNVELPLTSRDHAFLIDRHAGLIFDVRAQHRGNHESCTRFAGETKALGRSWRLGTVEELFMHVADRTKQEPAVDRDLFPKLGNDWLWSCTPDAKPSNPSSPAFAWGVYLYYGNAHLNGRSYGGLALPVSPLAAPASQS